MRYFIIRAGNSTYWLARNHGTTDDRRKAYLYTKEEADDITKNAVGILTVEDVRKGIKEWSPLHTLADQPASEDYATGGPVSLNVRKEKLAEFDHVRGDAKTRKKLPIYSGVIKYFPDAIVALAELSQTGNDQHNPGKSLHWDRDKSGDELDTLARHLVDAGKIDTDKVRHSTKVAWRALANLQKEIEEARAKEFGL